MDGFFLKSVAARTAIDPSHIEVCQNISAQELERAVAYSDLSSKISLYPTTDSGSSSG